MVPLGIAGNVGWYIDPIGQVQSFAPPYGKGHLLGLFCGRANYLRWAWPRWGQEGHRRLRGGGRSGGADRRVRRQGPWNSVEKIRGRGAGWRAAAGSCCTPARTC